MQFQLPVSQKSEPEKALVEMSGALRWEWGEEDGEETQRSAWVNFFVISCFPKNKMICLHCIKKKKV